MCCESRGGRFRQKRDRGQSSSFFPSLSLSFRSWCCEWKFFSFLSLIFFFLLARETFKIFSFLVVKQKKMRTHSSKQHYRCSPLIFGFSVTSLLFIYILFLCYAKVIVIYNIIYYWFQITAQTSMTKWTINERGRKRRRKIWDEKKTISALMPSPSMPYSSLYLSVLRKIEEEARGRKETLIEPTFFPFHFINLCFAKKKLNH